MVLYKCVRCGYSTNLKPRLIKHLNRKFICKPLLKNILPNELLDNENFGLINIINKKKSLIIRKKIKPNLSCSYCNKSFSRRDSLKRHQKKVCNKDNFVEKTNNAIQKAITGLKEQWKIALEQQRDEIFKQVNNNLTQQDCHNTYNTNTINVTNFGYENTSYLSPKLLTHYVNRPYLAIPRLISRIHFNPKHPENHNIKMTKSTPNDMIQVSEDNTWIYKNKDDIIHKLIKDKSTILEDHFDIVQQQIKEVKQMNFCTELKKWKSKEHPTKRKVEEALLTGTNDIEKINKKGEKINTI